MAKTGFEKVHNPYTVIGFLELQIYKAFLSVKQKKEFVASVVQKELRIPPSGRASIGYIRGVPKVIELYHPFNRDGSKKASMEIFTRGDESYLKIIHPETKKIHYRRFAPETATGFVAVDSIIGTANKLFKDRSMVYPVKISTLRHEIITAGKIRKKNKRQKRIHEIWSKVCDELRQPNKNTEDGQVLDKGLKEDLERYKTILEKLEKILGYISRNSMSSMLNGLNKALDVIDNSGDFEFNTLKNSDKYTLPSDKEFEVIPIPLEQPHITPIQSDRHYERGNRLLGSPEVIPVDSYSRQLEAEREAKEIVARAN